MLYILFYAASIGVFILACGTKEERFTLLLIATGLFLIPTAFVNFHLTEPDWNPHTTNEDLVGIWKDGDSYITLRSDGSALFNLSQDYANRVGLRDSIGGWQKKSDFTVQLLPFHLNKQRQVDAIKREGNTFRLTEADSLISLTRLLRIIRIDDKLCMVLLEYGDTDSWDGHSGFVLSAKTKSN